MEGVTAFSMGAGLRENFTFPVDMGVYLYSYKYMLLKNLDKIFSNNKRKHKDTFDLTVSNLTDFY